MTPIHANRRCLQCGRWLNRGVDARLRRRDAPGRRGTRPRVRVSWAVGHRGCNTCVARVTREGHPGSTVSRRTPAQEQTDHDNVIMEGTDEAVTTALLEA